MLRLALWTMRARRHGLVGAFAALSLAVALVYACGILMATGMRAAAPVQRYAAMPVVVAANQRIPVKLGAGGDESVESYLLPEQARIPVALARRVADVDGVQTVTADRSIPTTVATADGRLLSGPDGGPVVGHGWSSAALTPYRLAAGRAPGTPGEVVLDATMAAQGDVGVGAQVRISSTNGTSGYTVVGLTRPPPGRAWQGAAFVTDALAASLSADPARVDALGVGLEDGADPEQVAQQVQRTVGGGVAAYTGRDRGSVESLATTQRNQELVSLGGAFGGFAVLLAVFVVAATLGLSVLQRGRELALLRAVGAKPRQIRRLLLGEAAVVALAAGLVGLVPGALLGWFLFHQLQRRGIGADTASLVIGPLPAVIAVGTGLGTACLAAWIAGRRAARIRPTAALAEAAVEPKRIGPVRVLLGLGFLAGGVLLSATANALQGEAAAAASFFVGLVLMVAVGLLGPVLARMAAAGYGPVVAALFPTSGFLAMANLRTRARRFASASTSIALGVAFSLALVGSLSVQAKATEEQARQQVLAQRVLAAPGGLPPGLLDELRALPGVEAATSVLPTKVGAIYREFDGSTFDFLPAVGISPDGIDRTLDLDVREGSVAALPRDGVAVSVDRARSLGVAVGDPVSLRLGDGEPATLRVVATYASNLGFGEFVLPREVVAAHVSVPMDARMLVSYADGADLAALDARLAALAGHTPGLNVMEQAAMRAADAEQARVNGWVNYLMIGVLLAFIAVAAVNSLVMATGERARELALLRLIGATPRQVTRMVRVEALAVIGFGVLLGLAIAAATLVPFSLAIAETAIPSLPWQVLAGVLAGAAVLGLGASELPAHSLLRRDPVEAIGAQE
jgi:putative ABC transport system permease protein